MPKKSRVQEWLEGYVWRKKRIDALRAEEKNAADPLKAQYQDWITAMEAQQAETLEAIRSKGIKAGVALCPATPLNVLDYVWNKIDMVLLMTVNPGFGGQKYIPEMTEKIAKLRAEIGKRGLDIDIEVDGGINDRTIRTVLDAGANVCVAGSAVFGENIGENVKKYLAVMAEYKDR